MFFLRKLGEIDGVKFLAWKSGGVKFLTNSMSAWKYNYQSNTLHQGCRLGAGRPAVPGRVRQQQSLLWVPSWAGRHCCQFNDQGQCFIPSSQIYLRLRKYWFHNKSLIVKAYAERNTEGLEDRTWEQALAPRWWSYLLRLVLVAKVTKHVWLGKA